MSQPAAAADAEPVPGSVEAASWHPDRARAADFSGQSNLAVAFLCLPKEKRQDMDVFYTFCRVIDNIADSEALPPSERAEYLNAWRGALTKTKGIRQKVEGEGESPLLVEQMRELMAKYKIPVEHPIEIIAGCEMDVAGRRYETFAELREYCYRVASVVGLVSIEIFGYRDGSCRQYALDLGMALQLTNIIRDVGADLDNEGRIYLPAEDMARFGYSEADLRARTNDSRFEALMEFEAARAEEFYRSARASLSARDKPSMVAAEIMREIYWRVLQKARTARFDVFKNRVRLGKPRKLWVILVAAARARWF